MFGRFFMGTVPNDWAVLCRVVFAACIFFGWLQRLPWFADVLGPSGLGGAAMLASVGSADPIAGGSNIGLLKHVDSLAFVVVIYALTLGGALLLMLGRRVPLAGLLCIGGHALLMGRSPLAHWGWSYAVGPYLLWALLAGGSRSAGGQGPLCWKRVLQVHVCCLYAVAGFDRLDDIEWLLGESLFVAMTSHIFARFDMNLVWIAPILKLGSYFAFVLEPIAPFLLWLPRVGKFTALALIALHVGLEVTTDTGWWQYMNVAALFAFLPDSYAAWVVGRAQSLRRRLPSLARNRELAIPPR